MNLPTYTLEQLVSPEILLEIQTSFIKKHATAICIYNQEKKSLLPFPLSHPGLQNISEVQRPLFNLFFKSQHLNFDALSHSQKELTQSFAHGAILRQLVPIQFGDEGMGFALLVHFFKVFTKEKDKQFLDRIERVARQELEFNTLIDKNTNLTDKSKLAGQELQNILQLFLEAGRARAQIAIHEPERKNTKDLSDGSEIGILFSMPNGQIFECSHIVSEFFG